MRLATAALLVGRGAVCATPALAQDALASSWSSPHAATVQVGGASEGSSRLLAPILSLLLPGAGQHVLGQRRKWIYLALEAGGWVFFAERRRAGGDYRERYRDYAWDNGRLQTGTRVDGDFAYYETLTHWARSGVFDSDAGAAGIQPELDAQTYNGWLWSLARAIYGAGVNQTDPAYQDALAYYAARAYQPEMHWDWNAVPGAQEEFSELVDTSDRRFQQATTVLGVVFANHLLSAVDAYISSSTGVAARLRVVPGEVPGVGWNAVLSVPLQW